MKSSVRTYFLAIPVTLAALFVTQTAIADGNMATANINRIFNPKLSAMDLSAGTVHMRVKNEAVDVVAENIAAIFDPRIRSKRLKAKSASTLEPSKVRQDVAMDNIRRIFQAGKI